MDIKIKKLHEAAVRPKRGSLWSAGYDLTAVTLERVGDIYVFGTGLAFEIPKGWFGAVCARSSIYMQPFDKCGGVTVVDADYRGEVRVMFRRLEVDTDALSDFFELSGKSAIQRPYDVGDRVAQIVFQPCASVAFNWADELSLTMRGACGFGSTGL